MPTVAYEAPVGQKRCGKCRMVKPPEDFYRSGFQNDGLQSECKRCQKERRRGWYKNPANAEKAYLQRRRADIKRRFGISWEEYQDFVAGKVCDVCGGEGDKLGRLSVDHDHETGQLRGVLCTNCNLALGCVSDDPERLRALALYLERQRTVI